MFEFLQYNKLNILGSVELSKQFMPDDLDYDANLTTCISSKHGRSLAVKENDFNWILIKGGGWNYKGPILYRSTKDAELFFGLFYEKDAIREIEVSNALEKISDEFPKVLYYKKFEDYNLPKEYEFLKTVRHTNRNLVIPCLLYVVYNNDNPIIDPSTLFALTVLIAESNPTEMETMKQVVVSVLNKNARF